MLMNLVTKVYSYAEAFNIGTPDQKITGFEKSDCEFVPEPEPHWTWDRVVLRDLIVWWQNTKQRSNGCLLFGPTGAGKSGALQQFCAALQIPLYEKTICQGLEFQDLISQVDLAGGSTIPSYAWLPLAMGAEGYPGIFCANEIDRGDPQVLVGLHEVLDSRALLLHMGGLARVRPSPYFRFAATANTAMHGDGNKGYVSARQQDMALQDRFRMIKVDYLKPEEEKALLAKYASNLPEDWRNGMVRVANEIRRAHMGESNANHALPLTMSTRTLLQWAGMTWDYRAAEANGVNPMRYALDRAFLNATDGMPPEVKVALTTIIDGVLGSSAGAS